MSQAIAAIHMWNMKAVSFIVIKLLPRLVFVHATGVDGRAVILAPQT